jgi:hypothetical protein
MKAKVGDYVEFKCDVEQGGYVTAVRRSHLGDRVYTVEDEYGFDGDYIGGQTSTEVWAEDVYGVNGVYEGEE